MMEKGPNKEYVEIWTVPFHNYDPINVQLDNTGMFLFAIQPTPPLHSFVYPVSEEKSSTLFNVLIKFN